MIIANLLHKVRYKCSLADYSFSNDQYKNVLEYLKLGLQNVS